MTKKITGLYFGNNRSHAKTEIITQIFDLAYVQSAELVKLRKLPGKDLFEYECIIEIK